MMDVEIRNSTPQPASSMRLSQKVVNLNPLTLSLSKRSKIFGIFRSVGQCSKQDRHSVHPCTSEPFDKLRVSGNGTCCDSLSTGERGRNIRGVTLIELVLSIVIIAIAVSAVLGALSYSASRSADAMVRHQSVAIASTYLEEIVLKNFTADGVEASRSLYDDVSDYNGLNDVGARDQFGTAVAGLGQYTVTVAVGGGTLGSLSASTEVKRIDVNVQHATGVVVKISGYRTNN
jgi:MSHA pilin protein MshD